MNDLVKALVLSFLLSLAGSAAAEPVRQDLPTELRDKWDAAGQMFDDGAYAGALVQYREIYEQSDNPRVLYNIGITHKELQRYSKAIAAWEKQLAHRDALPADEVERAERAIDLVEPFVSTLEVQSNVPGATLFLNGDPVGKTPLVAPITVDVGKNVVVLKKEGYQPIEREIDVVKDQPATVELSLTPVEKTGTVSISIAGAEEATIFVDGTEMGPAPFKGEVPVGRHTFEARAPGRVTARQTSVVRFGQTVRVTLTLVDARKEGKLRVVVDGHPDATIVIDGETVGAGAWEGLLPAGGHELEVKAEGYLPFEREVALVSDQERTLHVDLEKDRRTAWIYWTVTGVAVLAGASVAGYFVLRPSETSQVTGTFDPGVVPTLIRF